MTLLKHSPKFETFSQNLREIKFLGLNAKNVLLNYLNQPGNIYFHKDRNSVKIEKMNDYNI